MKVPNRRRLNALLIKFVMRLQTFLIVIYILSSAHNIALSCFEFAVRTLNYINLCHTVAFLYLRRCFVFPEAVKCIKYAGKE